MNAMYWKPVSGGVLTDTPLDVFIDVEDEGFDDDYLTIEGVEVRLINGRAWMVDAKGRFPEVLGWDFARAIAWRPHNAN